MAETPKKTVRGWPRHCASVYEHVYSSPDREVGGVLVGELINNNTLAITGVIPALDAVGGAAEVTFTHESWESIHRELDDRYPGKQIIGWYHSHPSFGIFLSDQDMFIHENFFSEWWQIAVVVDPIRNEEGFFFWRGGKVAQTIKRDVPEQAIPQDLRPAEDAEAPQARATPRNINLGLWALPLLVGAFLGFIGAPAVGVGDSPEIPAPAPQRAPVESSDPTEAASEGRGQGSSPKPTPDECRAFLLETGELKAGCPLSTLGK